MRTLRALVEAQAVAAWNRTVRDSGGAGPATTAVILMVVALVVAIPGFITFRAGLILGHKLAVGNDAEALLFFASLQALFTVLFAVCGGFRHNIVFSRRDVGMYPIPRVALLTAEIPASAIEVFPLLGGIGILCSNLGLAVALPKAAPLVALLAAQGILFMLLLQHLMGSLKRFFFKRPIVVLALTLGLLVLVVGALVERGGDPREPIRASVQLIISLLPGSLGYEGLVDLLAGRVGAGSLHLAAMAAATAGLAFLTAWLHSRELATEQRTLIRRRGEPRVLRFRRPSWGIARLHVIQLLDSHQGRVQFFIPLLLAGCAGVYFWAMETAMRDGETLPDWLTALNSRTAQLPLFEVFLIMVIWVNAEIWTNHFGWDRGGLRDLLTLPLSPRDLLLGKFVGVLCFTALQAAVCVGPLLLVYRPDAAEVVAGLAAAGAILVAVNAGGHLLAIRFPRPVSSGGTSTLPIYLSWIPGLGMLTLTSVIVIAHAAVEGLGRWAAPAVFALMLAAAMTAYCRALPAIEAVLVRNRERLIGM